MNIFQNKSLAIKCTNVSFVVEYTAMFPISVHPAALVFAAPQPRVIEVQGRAQALARSMMKVCEVDSNVLVWVRLSTKTVGVVCSLLHCKKACLVSEKKIKVLLIGPPPKGSKRSLNGIGKYVPS